jgi:MFS family permease
LAGLAVAGGPLIGGAVTEGLNWHWIFRLNVPIGLAAVALSRARLPESHGRPARLDIPALVLLRGFGPMSAFEAYLERGRKERASYVEHWQRRRDRYIRKDDPVFAVKATPRSSCRRPAVCADSHS